MAFVDAFILYLSLLAKRKEKRGKGEKHYRERNANMRQHASTRQHGRDILLASSRSYPIAVTSEIQAGIASARIPPYPLALWRVKPFSQVTEPRIVATPKPAPAHCCEEKAEKGDRYIFSHFSWPSLPGNSTHLSMIFSLSSTRSDPSLLLGQAASRLPRWRELGSINKSVPFSH